MKVSHRKKKTGSGEEQHPGGKSRRDRSKSDYRPYRSKLNPKLQKQLGDIRYQRASQMALSRVRANFKNALIQTNITVAIPFTLNLIFQTLIDIMNSKMGFQLPPIDIKRNKHSLFTDISFYFFELVRVQIPGKMNEAYELGKKLIWAMTYLAMSCVSSITNYALGIVSPKISQDFIMKDDLVSKLSLMGSAFGPTGAPPSSDDELQIEEIQNEYFNDLGEIIDILYSCKDETSNPHIILVEQLDELKNMVVRAHSAWLQRLKDSKLGRDLGEYGQGHIQSYVAELEVQREDLRKLLSDEKYKDEFNKLTDKINTMRGQDIAKGLVRKLSYAPEEGATAEVAPVAAPLARTDTEPYPSSEDELDERVPDHRLDEEFNAAVAASKAK